MHSYEFESFILKYIQNKSKIRNNRMGKVKIAYVRRQCKFFKILIHAFFRLI